MNDCTEMFVIYFPYQNGMGSFFADLLIYCYK